MTVGSQRSNQVCTYRRFCDSYANLRELCERELCSEMVPLSHILLPLHEDRSDEIEHDNNLRP